jgi:hypothetical protein
MVNLEFGTLSGFLKNVIWAVAPPGFSQHIYGVKALRQRATQVSIANPAGTFFSLPE